MAGDLDTIKQGLKERIEDVCARLLPHGRRIGRLWVSHNPVTGDWKKTPELKVALNRDAGAWKDWRSGDKGDVLKLVQYVLGTDVKGALAFGRDFLGLRAMSADERRDWNRKAAARRETEDRRAIERARWYRKAAEKKWLDGRQDGAGSAAEALARAYFAARRCPLDAVPARDRDTMRFTPAAEYWTAAEYRTDATTGRRVRTAPGPDFPAVLSAYRAPTGQLVATHVTFLDPVEPQKADVPGGTAKLTFGECKGGVIRVSHGPEGVPPDMAREAHPLVVCEGIEDALSLATALPECRVWAAGSLGNLPSVPVWLDCVSEIYVARDNDWGKDQALAQFDAAIAALMAHGKPLTVMQSHGGKDFNDLMKGNDHG